MIQSGKELVKGSELNGDILLEVAALGLLTEAECGLSVDARAEAPSFLIQ